MPSRRKERQLCCMCNCGIRHGDRVRLVVEPSILPNYVSLVGDSSGVTSDHCLCPKCYGKVRTHSRQKLDDGKRSFKSLSEATSVKPPETPSSSYNSQTSSGLSASSVENCSSPSVLLPQSSEHSGSPPETPSPYEDFPDFMNLNEQGEESMPSFSMDQSSEPFSISTAESTKTQSSSSESQQSSIYRLKLASVPFSQSRCFICKSPNGRGVVPKAAIKQIFTHLDIFIPSSTRCCHHHLTRENTFYHDALEKIEATKTEIDVSASDFGDWLMTISTDFQKRTSKYVSFEDGGVDDSSYRMLTSLEKSDFDKLYSQFVSGYLNNSCNRTPRDALGMFLMILRKNLTQDLVAFLFGVSQPVVSTTIHAVKKALLTSFVPKNLGVDPINNMTREDAVKNHSVKFFNQVFEKSQMCLALVMDATYFYIEKPGEFDAQSMTFSMHKHRNLLKVMLAVLPDGHILAAYGPYWANGGNNDAKILEHILGTTDFGLFQDPGDYSIVDRGFRDVVDEMESYGVDVYMPSLLKKDQKSFTVEQSTSSRKVTSCRWVVEAVNGRLKNVFKYFGAVIEAGYSAETIFDFCQISCAILNAFYPPLVKDDPKHNGLALRMLEKAKSTTNALNLELEAKNITTRFPSEWEKVSASSLADFPTLTQDELVVQVSSVYQLKMARRYIDANIEDSGWQVLVHREDQNLLRAKISSRFQSNKTHQVFIKTDSSKSGIEAVVGHCCDCKNGLRVVGSCSHVAAVLRYLCYERHLPVVVNTRKRRRFEGVIDAKAELLKLRSQ